MAAKWEQPLNDIKKTLDEIKSEVKENRSAVQSLKQEMATGKGSIKAVMWLGGLIGAIWTIIRIMDIG